MMVDNFRTSGKRSMAPAPSREFRSARLEVLEELALLLRREIEARPFLSIQLDCRTPRPARTNLRAGRRRRSEAIPALAHASKVAGEPENHEHQHDKS